MAGKAIDSMWLNLVPDPPVQQIGDVLRVRVCVGASVNSDGDPTLEFRTIDIPGGREYEPNEPGVKRVLEAKVHVE